MAGNKGYPSKERDLRLSEQDVYVTAEPVREKQHGISVNAHMYVRVVGTDAAEANSTTKVIVATAHAAKVGDIIRMTSGNLSGQEIKVLKKDANSITLAETLAEAPAAADTFQILRHKYPVVNASGELTVSTSSAPIQFVRDGVDTEVLDDTGTPANSRPLPVKLVGAAGDINITAGDLNVSLNSANDSVAAVQSGTWNITNVSGTVSLPTGAATAANQATGNTSLSNIDDKLPALSSGRVPVDGSGVTQPVSAAALPLPTGASTEATLSTLNGKVPAGLTVASNRLQVVVDRLAAAGFVRNDYASTSVTTGAYVELIASTAAAYKKLQIFDSSGQTLKLATGAGGAESDILAIFPGGNGEIEVNIAAGTRLSVRAVSGSASVGELIINLIG